MRDFQRNRRDDRRRGDSRGVRDFRGRDFDRSPQMFKTICSNCGKECEVPFKPTGEKPVYCRECFQKMGGNGRDDRRRDDSRGGRDNFNRRFDFGERRNQENMQPAPQNNEFSKLNEKLDKIINLLSQKQTPEAAKVTKVKEEVEEKVIVKPTKTKKKKVVKIPEEITKE